MFRVLMFLVVFFSVAAPVCANDLAISAVSLLSQSTADAMMTNHTRDIQFTVAWSNSWCMAGSACDGGASTNAGGNWDAVWVFAKYAVYTNGAWGAWNHCTLSTTGHTEPAGSQIVTSADGKGVFIYRDAAGSGANTFTNVAIRWRYGADNVSDSDLVKVQVFGVEMVYIPQESFYAGDLATSTASFKQGTADTDPWVISSEGAITTTNTAADGYYYVSSGNVGEAASGDVFTIPADFPKGYNDFYIMKYELSQGQWRDFLNTLTQAQQITYVAADLSNEDDANTYVMVVEDQAAVSYRQTIKAGANPADGMPYTFGCDLDDNDTLDEAADGEWIAMNYVSWGDLVGFADWAALRPFTNLEFEKAARGPLWPVAGEYSWGSTSISAATTPTPGGEMSEGSTLTTANCVYNNTASLQGPLRVGGIAKNGDGTRARSGSSYYGVMELSGNLWERPVTLGNATGRAFTGLHGDGSLVSLPTNWPLSSDAIGVGFRGGYWRNGSGQIRISDRLYEPYDRATRSYSDGIRVARTAP